MSPAARDVDALLECAVVLAGGGSTRMGRDKALVELGGRPALARLACGLALLSPRIVVSLADGGLVDRYAAAIEAAGGPGVEFVTDETRGRGPLEGVRCALRHLERSACRCALFVAVDCAFVWSALARRLADESSRPGTRGAVPVHGERTEPAFAMYSTGLLDDIEAALAADRRSLGQMARWSGVRHVDPASAGACPIPLDDIFLNVNAPTDLDRARALIASRGLGGDAVV